MSCMIEPNVSLNKCLTGRYVGLSYWMYQQYGVVGPPVAQPGENCLYLKRKWKTSHILNEAERGLLSIYQVFQ